MTQVRLRFRHSRPTDEVGVGRSLDGAILVGLRHRSNDLFPWIALASLVRLALAPFTSHPFDMTAWVTLQDRFFNAGVNPLANSKFSAVLTSLLMSTFVPAGFTAEWLNLPMTLAQQFWIKLPFIAADVAIALVLRDIVERATSDPRRGRLAAILWLFNPASIFFTSIHGQLDALPALLLLAGILLAQRGRFSAAFAAVFGAGVAKYFGFIALPLFWLWFQRRKRPHPFQVVAVSGVAFVLAFPSVLVPWLRSDLVSGVASSTVATDYLSRWSLWGPLVQPGQGVGLLWLAEYGFAYVMLLALARRARSERPGDPVPLLALLTAAIAILVALDPVSNPQFVLWVLPLLVALICIFRSAVLAWLTLALVCLNLLSLWMVEGFRVWFYNAVPRINLLNIWLDPSNELLGYGAATNLGFLYSLLLLGVAVWAIVLGVRAQVVAESGPRMRWIKPVLRTVLVRAASLGRSKILWICGLAMHITGGLVVSALFLTLAFQPVVWNEFTATPNYPPGLEARNTFSAMSVRADPQVPNGLIAAWSSRDQTFLTGYLSDVSLRVTGSETLQPVLGRTRQTEPVSVGRRRVRVDFVLSSQAQLVRVRLLLYNERFGEAGGPSLPEVTLRADGNLVEARPTVELEAEGGGWYLVRVDQLEPFVARRFQVELQAPRPEGWIWNGGGGPSGPGVSTYVAGKLVETAVWFQVWAITAEPLSPVWHRIRLTPDDRLQVIAPVTPGADLGDVRIGVPPQMTGDRGASVALVLDVVGNRWWQERPALAFFVALLAAALVLGYAVFVCWAFQWVWRRVGGA